MLPCSLAVFQKFFHSVFLTVLICLLSIVPFNLAFTFPHKRQADFVQILSHYELSIPSRVSSNGEHLSYLVHPDYTRHRCSRSTENNRDKISENALHYKVNVENKDLYLKVKHNKKLISPHLVIERRKNVYKNITDSSLEKLVDPGCHYHGDIIGDPGSIVSLHVCDGLTGLIHTSMTKYFIEPVRNQLTNIEDGHHHIVYKPSSLSIHLNKQENTHYDRQKKEEASCGVQDKHKVDPFKQRERYEKHRQRRSSKKHSRHKRSISVEKHVEAMVVVDTNMMEYYKNEDVTNYVLTIMNMVSTIFHDATIGNAVNIVIVRIMLLEEHQDDLKITHHADKTLKSFCKWQKRLNPKDDDDPHHHDVAILLTRKNICSRLNEPCSTLGLAQVAGICQPHRSCNINEDTGLPLAFTVAHELGHNFGMRHDGVRNECDLKENEEYMYVMAAHLIATSGPIRWSECSKRSITKFIDRGWAYCLDDEPEDHEDFVYPVLPPGTMYDADHQCRLTYGGDAVLCEGTKKDVCSTLWCRVNNKCSTKLDAGAEGTICDQNKWCFNGNCTDIGERPEAINGNWGEWSSWSDCTRTCGAGVSTVERHCDNPMPSNGGKYCIGERKRYRICNTEPCEENTPSFRSIQCEEFNYIPYRNGLYEWETVSIPRNPCQLHCKPKNKFFSVMLKDTVTDGTPCTPGTRNMCISGRCRHVGCDWVIDSSAREDKCGICHGDGSSCETIKDQYNETQGLGYVEATVIPENARNIRVEEIAEANNYLALKNDKGDYYLNGHWFIQWSGDYEIAGTVVHYKREGNKEMFEAVGPLKEPLHIMLLLQSHNPGVSFEYTVPKINASVGRRSDFHWKYMDWTHCTSSCGGGTQRSAVVCAERDGIVEDMYCNATTKPDDKMRVCNVHLCPARWWSGPWQHCSVTCGEGGVHRRTVICVRSLSEEQIALEDKACDGQDKPLEVETCHHKNACPGTSTWVVGDWVECGRNPCEMQTRPVTCKEAEIGCNELTKPISSRKCSNVTCGNWTTDPWSECTRTCGGGIKYRKVSCTGSQLCDLETEPPSQSPCNNGDCPTTMHVTTPSLQVSHTSDQSDEATPVHNVTHSIENKENLAIENNNTETTKLKIDTSANSNNYALQPDILNESSKQDFINVKIHDTHVNQSNSKDLEQGVNIVLGSEDSFLNIQEGGLNLPERRINIHHNKKPEEDKNVRPDENDVQIGIEQMKHKHSKTEKKMNLMPLLSNIGPGRVRGDKSLRPLPDLPFIPKIPVRSPIIPSTSESKFIWIPQNWTECSRNCGGGIRTRSVVCLNVTFNKVVEQRNCDILSKPLAIEQCNIDKCLEWTVSEWSLCSSTCGRATQRRNVYCTAVDLCDNAKKPEQTRSCNNPDCLAWVHGQWSRCSKTCGTGEQVRLVQCVNITSQQSAIGCPNQSKPVETKSCNTNECPEENSAFNTHTCLENKMNDAVCRALRRMKKCDKPFVKLNCCKTCGMREWNHNRPHKRRS